MADLESASAAFINSNPYARVVELDVDGATQLHKIKLTQPFPEDISDIASDALDNLRSVLDHAAYGAAVAGGKTTPEYAYFPFSNSAENLANRAKGLCKDIPSDVTALFCRLKPYKGGNNALWALNYVRGANQHALLTPVGSANTTVKIGAFRMVASASGSAIFNPPMWNPSTWDSKKNEMIIARLDPGSTLNYNFEFTPFIAFGDVEVFANEPVIGVLNHLVREVEDILLGTEAECRRLGFIT